MSDIDKKKYETVVHPLKPLYDENSKVLILGSFPSIKTREMKFFYGHPQNRFWKVLEKVLEEHEPLIDNDVKRRVLLNRNIALWDSIYQCDIVGSADASIKNVVPSDLTAIFETADIKQVFCNGATSFKYYQKFQAKRYQKNAVMLPSTSPANAAYSLERLSDSWRVLRDFV